MLTPQQKRVYDYIVKFRDDNGFPPTVAEIAEAIDRSRGTTHAFMVHLENKGYIKILGSPRAIKIMERAE